MAVPLTAANALRSAWWIACDAPTCDGRGAPETARRPALAHALLKPVRHRAAWGACHTGSRAVKPVAPGLVVGLVLIVAAADARAQGIEPIAVTADPAAAV